MVVSRQCNIAATTFHITSTNPIPLYSFSPFGINTTVCHVASSAILPTQNAVCIRSTSFSQRFPPSSSSSVFSSRLSAAIFPLLDAASHPFRCSARIPDGPPDLFLLSFFNASLISSYIGNESSTSARVTVTGMFSPGMVRSCRDQPTPP